MIILDYLKIFTWREAPRSGRGPADLELEDKMMEGGGGRRRSSGRSGGERGGRGQLRLSGRIVEEELFLEGWDGLGIEVWALVVKLVAWRLGG